MFGVFRGRIAPALVGVVMIGVLLTWPGAEQAGAHGSTQSPASRVYSCRFEQPNNPMCSQAWAANPQALYDWMEVNIGDANGRHQELIPDGQLCSAGRQKYAAFDVPGAWPVTPLATDSTGMVDLVYENTAPHATAYYRVYLTRAGFDARVDSLGWGDLELVYDSGPLDRASIHTLTAPLPDRKSPAVLYVVWQRSDSPEAFYACGDVTVNAGTGEPTPTSTPQPTTTTAPLPSTTQLPASTDAPTTQTVTTETVAPQTVTSQAETSQATTSQTETSQTETSQTVTSQTMPAQTETPQTVAPQTSEPTAAPPAEPPTTAESQPTLVPAAPTTASQEASLATSPSAPAPAPAPAPVPATIAPALASGSDVTAGVTSDANAEDPGVVEQLVASPATEPAGRPERRGSPLGLAMIGIGSIGLVLMGVALRWPHRIFP